MRLFPLLLGGLLIGCTGEGNRLGGPVLWQSQVFGNGANESAAQSRHAAVEVFVKSNHPALMEELNAGTGPLLTQMMDVAGTPAQNRSGLILDLRSDRGLYQASPDAMIARVMVYS